MKRLLFLMIDFIHLLFCATLLTVLILKEGIIGPPEKNR